MRKLSTEVTTELRDSLLAENIVLSRVLSKVNAHKYIVGGYIRDYISKSQKGRDVDIMVDISRNELQTILDREGVKYTLNHFGGFKFVDSISVDIWSIQDNWAFRTNLVNASRKHMKRAISRGCFYNYDALVMDLSDCSYEVGPYEAFLKTRTLDILQSDIRYRIENPTALANVIRALWIKIYLNCIFSDRLERYIDYVLEEYGQNRAQYQVLLNEIKNKYIKYSASEEMWETIVRYCDRKLNGEDSDGQLQLSVPEHYYQEKIEFVY